MRDDYHDGYVVHVDLGKQVLKQEVKRRSSKLFQERNRLTQDIREAKRSYALWRKHPVRLYKIVGSMFETK